MARIRSIHPDVCVSPKMAKLSAPLERTFFRLLTHCDDQGRAYDNALLIKAALYPLVVEMTPDLVEAELVELAAEGLICRYVADGKRCLVITSWDEYQHPQRPTKEKLPAPSMQCIANARQLLRGDMQSHGDGYAMTGQEGRAECMDASRTYIDADRNPNRLEEVLTTIKSRKAKAS